MYFITDLEEVEASKQEDTLGNVQPENTCMVGEMWQSQVDKFVQRNISQHR